MSDTEFWEIVEIEGLEYYLNYKNTDWHFLENEKLRNLCFEYVELHKAIMKFN